MTTAELGLATTSAATLSAATAMKALVYIWSRQTSLGGRGAPHHPSGRCNPGDHHFNDLRNRSSYSEARSVLHASRRSRKVMLADIARKFPEQNSRKESKG
jgi:hypothetical protein